MMTFVSSWNELLMALVFISDVNKKYAASTTWDDKVARNMVSYYATISKSRSAALDRLK